MPFSCAYSSASRDLPGERQRLVDRHRPERDPLGERLPVDELQHQRFDAVGFYTP